MYWAHSDPSLSPEEPGNDWQGLAEHLQNVAEIARELAECATTRGSSLGAMAFAAGMLHDYGKYKDCFQARLVDKTTRCPHAIYGAVALRQFDGVRQRLDDRSWMLPAVCAVSAHHAGLKDWHEHKSDTAPPCDGEIESNGPAEHRRIAEGLLTRALEDQPKLREALAITRPEVEQGTRDMRTRILLSCLVDADRLNTSGQQPVQESPRAEERLTQLTTYLKMVVAAAARDTDATVRNARDEVQQMCARAANKKPGLFSLCVPTGGGKMLASMRFALEHAAAHPGELRRVIVVIPYLSIIEQNAKVYADVFGQDTVLEHHSSAVYSLDRSGSPSRVASDDETSAAMILPVETENWDAPVIVTTSMRFFESLFSNHPSDLRRIHNIARSVIVLD